MTAITIQTLRNLCLVLLLQLCIEGLIPASLHAQVAQTFYVKENTRTRRAVPFTHERETDIMWSKRVWRTIDLREKFNHPLYYPESPLNDRKSLFDVIKQGLLDGEIHAFDNPAFDDEFKVKMSKTQLDSLFNPVEWKEVEDPFNPGTFTPVAIPDPLTSNKVTQYWIKEDWFFDRQRSVMDVRIIGLCPLQEKMVNGSFVGYKALFWVYFPECRPLFARSEVFNTRNDAQRCSVDDIFMKRMFQSFVRKESNVYDRAIGDYAIELDALLEAERVKGEITNMEHDVWHF